MKMSQGKLYICVIMVLIIMVQRTEARILRPKKVILFELSKNVTRGVFYPLEIMHFQKIHYEYNNTFKESEQRKKKGLSEPFQVLFERIKVDKSQERKYKLMRISPGGPDPKHH